MTTINAQAVHVQPSVHVVIVGHVDHGKSTLVGRLLCDTGSVPVSRCEAVRSVCESSGKHFEYAFLLDALEEERDQGITIDTMQVKFRSALREYVIIDAPGHKEFLKNMVTGAASAEAAVLLIDAAEGIQEQSRRHGFLLHLLGIRQIIVIINKMDLVDYSRDVFNRLSRDYQAFLSKLCLAPLAVIPVVAREGFNITTRSGPMDWYAGPSFLEALDSLSARRSRSELPLRLPVQDVYKFDTRRIIAGRVGSGKVADEDTILFSPSNHSAVVKSIERWSSSRVGPAKAGESIGLTLTEQLFVERGQIVSHPNRSPLVSSQFQAEVFWLGERHLVRGKDYILKLATQEAKAQVSSIDEVVDAVTLETVAGQHEVARNEVAKITLSLDRPVAFDLFGEFEETGRFVLVDGFDVAGGGIILAAVPPGYII
ncbi:MAG: GTP-binding protein [Planctomycetota bacterium]